MNLIRLPALCLLMAIIAACAENTQAPAQTATEASADASKAAAQDPATTLYFNGKIITMDESLPTVEAVAVRDGKILAVGNKADVEAVAGNNVKQNDLQGNTLIPGLIDAHGHISFTAQTLASANVSSPPVGKAETVDDVVRLMQEQADKYPDAEWVFGWGYDDSLLAEKRHPTRDDLDKVSTTKPVAMRHVSGHFMSCNSKCLELAGINAEMKDPDGGIIRRRADSNEPDGVLEETAMAPLYSILPQPDTQTLMQLLKKAQQYYASHGITTIQDGATDGGNLALMKAASKQGVFELDVVAYPYVMFFADKLDQVNPSQEYSNHFRVGGLKLVLDGSPQGKTAWLTKPYLHPPHGQNADYVGYPTLKDEQVNEYVDYAFANNIPLLAHANGDAASDQMINAVAAANQKHGNADRRSVMIHAQTVREDQIDAMLAQNIVPSYFSAHTFYWGDWHRDSVFGVERASRISPLRSSVDKGLRFTTHNDTPIVPPDMMRLLWASVNRITRSDQVLGEAQRITPLQALRSMTIDAAYQYFEEDSKGSITEGKIADLVVLDDNPLTIDPKSIKDIQVLQTIKDGVVIYDESLF